MKHAPEYIQVMDKLKPLFRDHNYFCVMPFDLLCDWVAYFWNRATISYVLGKDGTARGVCLIKFFRELGRFRQPFVHEPDGNFCMVEVLVARDPIAIALMYFELKDRWGKPAVMMWDRGERTKGGAPRMYRWDQYEKLTRRLTYGLIDKENAVYGISKSA